MPVIDYIKQLNSENVMEKLPASYNVNNSIISKILEVFTSELNEIIIAINDVEKINDIDVNFGKSLDYLGSNYSVNRDGENDNEYLNRIKSKIITTGSIGDENSIIGGLAGYFNLEQTLFQVETVGLRTIEVIYPSEIEESKILEVLKNLKAAGIKLVLTKDRFWEDMTYEEISELTYDELKKFRYGRRR